MTESFIEAKLRDPSRVGRIPTSDPAIRWVLLFRGAIVFGMVALADADFGPERRHGCRLRTRFMIVASFVNSSTPIL
jgi:hypothetical protein